MARRFFARRQPAPARLLVPPERIDAGPVELRRLTSDDAAALSEAARASLEHLRPWMPWATVHGTSVETQTARLFGPAGVWTSGSGYEFGIFLPDGRMVGGCGLHRRIGPAALEIGYWVHVDHVRRGFASAAAAALTDTGFALRGVERMEIHCDEANTASAAVPRTLGYRLEARVAHPPEAPGETGTRLVWIVYRREWETRARRL
ncbi:MAG: GNAT family protein [Acidimicrobiales bacterium]